MRSAARITLSGLVQGVGFRPFVSRVAKSFNLSGWVLNSRGGVEIEVEGEKNLIHKFYLKILNSHPPMARILKKNIEFHTPVGLKEFQIKESKESEYEFTLISADISICEACYRELFDVKNRRYLYPFINCINCGPRFTIIKTIPYDRKNTTMEKFKMCRECQSEYDNVADRRYHDQPNACKKCGPKIWIVSRDGVEIICNSPIKKAIDFIKEGSIVAVKGIGGFHLCCNAQDSTAIEKLRLRKKREKFKPFAIMSKDLDKVTRFCFVNSKEAALLSSPWRPIVLLKRKDTTVISEMVAPNNNYLGVMLPYSPLHYLLLDDEEIIALVMTSANLSDEPIIKDNTEAVERLPQLADYILLHDRDIHNRTDDSVTQIVQGREVIIRRSRGYAPLPIRLNIHTKKPILAVGGELKNTFCLTRDEWAFISQHIGDLKNFQTLQFFKEAIEQYKKLFFIQPQAVAYDLHPDYLSTKFALELAAKTKITAFGVQHHHAHIASCLAENGIEEPTIGVALDGLGYGLDDNIWGFEFFVVDCSFDFRRVGHLRYIPMPGGDKATLEPYRMAISYLYSIYDKEIPDKFLRRWGEKVSFIIKMLERGINSPLTSSAGRLFDAIASIIGTRDVIDYEAQAALELEMLAKDGCCEVYKYKIYKDDNLCYIIDPTSMIEEITEEVIKNKKDKSIISTKFHNTIVDMILRLCDKIKEETFINKVALSGGVFQNRYLLKRLLRMLKKAGFYPILHSKVPPNDAGISLGQAFLCALNS